jgi:hypothetical protein
MTPPAPESDQGKLRAQKDGLWNAVIKRYEDGETWRLAINLALVGGGGLLSGLGGLGSFTEPNSSWLKVIGIVMIFAGAVLVGVFDRKRTDLTSNAKKSLLLADGFLDEKKKLETRIGDGEALDRKRVYLLNGINAMLETAERSTGEADIAKAVKAVLDAGTYFLEGAIGFEAGEKWNFSIFRAIAAADGKPTAMRRIAFTCAEPPAENAGEREWAINEGFTGKAWQANDEEVWPDIGKPDVASRFTVPAEKRKDGDEGRYVSIAVVPIRVGKDGPMWGTVTATSDREGRWVRDPTDPREQNLRAVRILSQIIAAQVAQRQN